MFPKDILSDRCRITAADHEDFQKSISRPPQADEIDELVEELRAAEFEEKGAGL